VPPEESLVPHLRYPDQQRIRPQRTGGVRRAGSSGRSANEDMAVACPFPLTLSGNSVRLL